MEIMIFSSQSSISSFTLLGVLFLIELRVLRTNCKMQRTEIRNRNNELGWKTDRWVWYVIAFQYYNITITTPPPLSSFQKHYYTITITTVSTTTINSIPASQSLEHHQNNLIIRSSRIIVYAIHGCCCFRICINYVMQQTI